tara:strand:- start:388 stop:951 length:564 start_codon:yes stop_codon:yes gene_type:complete
MDFKSLNKKIENDILNIAKPSVLFHELEGSRYTEHFVTEDEVCRIDLISLNEYGTSAMGDVILKFNNISNPFSFNEGDMIMIPDRSIGMKNWQEIVGFDIPELNEVKAQFLETKRLTEADSKRIEYLKAKAEKKANGSSIPAPPNILKPGDSNVVIGNGKISLNPSAFAKFNEKKESPIDGFDKLKS